MMISNMPMGDIKIGQVVQFPNQLGIVIQISAEVAGFKPKTKRRDPQADTGNYVDERYSTITYILESGRIVTPMFHMNNDYEILEYVLNEQEIYNFDSIDFERIKFLTQAHT